MRKLELNHLSSYLPYGLKFIDKVTEITHVLDSENLSGVLDDIEHLNTIKPILRPLSDLTKEIEHNGEKFVPSIEFENLYLNYSKWGDNSIGTGIIGKNGFMTHLCFMHNEIIGECPLAIYKLLIEWHFDIFGLIEKGLAIDINTIKEKC